MWKRVKIATDTAFMRCFITEAEAQCILYDLEHCWIAIQTFVELQQQVKLLNKRFKYDAQSAASTLQTATPEQANWVENGTAEVSTEGRTLKLKYRVREHPFHFEWHFKKQTANDLKSLALREVAGNFQLLMQLVSELRDAVVRKDEEIAQYKREGCVLRITTKETQIYNVKTLDERLAGVTGFSKLIEQLEEREEMTSVSLEETDAMKGLDKTPTRTKRTLIEKSSMEEQTANKTESPRHRKRKAVQNEKLRLSRTLKTSKRKIEYESSESQSLTDSQETVASIEQDTKDAISGGRKRTKVEVNAQAMQKNNKAVVNSNDRNELITNPKDAKHKEQKNMHIKEEACSSKTHISNVTAVERKSTATLVEASVSQSAINTSPIVTKTEKNVNVVLRGMDTSELHAYLDTVLNEFDEIDKKLQMCFKS